MTALRIWTPTTPTQNFVALVVYANLLGTKHRNSPKKRRRLRQGQESEKIYTITFARRACYRYTVISIDINVIKPYDM